MDKHQTKQLDRKTQRERFEEAARESGADMGKKEFSRVLGKVARKVTSPDRNEDQSSQAGSSDPEN